MSTGESQNSQASSGARSSLGQILIAYAHTLPGFDFPSLRSSSSSSPPANESTGYAAGNQATENEAAAPSGYAAAADTSTPTGYNVPADTSTPTGYNVPADTSASAGYGQSSTSAKGNKYGQEPDLELRSSEAAPAPVRATTSSGEEISYGALSALDQRPRAAQSAADTTSTNMQQSPPEFITPQKQLSDIEYQLNSIQRRLDQVGPLIQLHAAWFDKAEMLMDWTSANSIHISADRLHSLVSRNVDEVKSFDVNSLSLEIRNAFEKFRAVVVDRLTRYNDAEAALAALQGQVNMAELRRQLASVDTLASSNLAKLKTKLQGQLDDIELRLQDLSAESAPVPVSAPASQDFADALAEAPDGKNAVGLDMVALVKDMQATSKRLQQLSKLQVNSSETAEAALRQLDAISQSCDLEQFEEGSPLLVQVESLTRQADEATGAFMEACAETIRKFSDLALDNYPAIRKVQQRLLKYCAEACPAALQTTQLEKAGKSDNAEGKQTTQAEKQTMLLDAFNQSILGGIETISTLGETEGKDLKDFASITTEASIAKFFKQNPDASLADIWPLIGAIEQLGGQAILAAKSMDAIRTALAKGGIDLIEANLQRGVIDASKALEFIDKYGRMQSDAVAKLNTLKVSIAQLSSNFQAKFESLLKQSPIEAYRFCLASGHEVTEVADLLSAQLTTLCNRGGLSLSQLQELVELFQGEAFFADISQTLAKATAESVQAEAIDKSENLALAMRLINQVIRIVDAKRADELAAQIKLKQQAKLNTHFEKCLKADPVGALRVWQASSQSIERPDAVEALAQSLRDHFASMSDSASDALALFNELQSIKPLFQLVGTDIALSIANRLESPGALDKLDTQSARTFCEKILTKIDAQRAQALLTQIQELA